MKMRSVTSAHRRFGMPFFIPVEYYDTRVQFNDNVSWLRGSHSIKAGVDIDIGRNLFLNLDVKYIDIDTTATLLSENEAAAD